MRVIREIQHRVVVGCVCVTSLCLPLRHKMFAENGSYSCESFGEERIHVICVVLLLAPIQIFF